MKSLSLLLLLLLSVVVLAQQQPKAPTVAQAKAQYDLALAKHDILAMADAAYLLGKRCRAEGDYVAGRRWLLYALRIWEPRGPSVELNRVYIQLVGDVSGVSNFPQAFSYAYRALANSRKLDHPHSRMSAFNCLGGLHCGVAAGQAATYSQWAGEKARKVAADSAVWYYQQAERIAVTQDNPKELAIIRTVKGGMLLDSDPQKAIALLTYALHIYEQQGAYQSQVNTNLALVTAHINLNHLSKAHKHLLAIGGVFRKSNQIDAHIPADVNYAWADWHRASGHWQEAFMHLKMADSSRKAGLTAEQRAVISRLNVAYETERRETMLKTKQAELALQQNRFQEQQRYTVAALGLLLVAVLVGGLFYRLNRENKRISLQNAHLLAEQSHRMKNNFQAISGLLSLQSNRLHDEDARQAIQESGLRVQTMALLNRKLYDTNRLVSLGLPTVIPDLVQAILKSYGYEYIEPAYDLQPVPLHPDQAIPIALIVNELVTNACKYAFPNNPAPALSIRCWQERGRLHIQVQDNGPGMPTNADARGFGMYLIALQVRQIGGDFTISGPSGVTFEVSADIKQSVIANWVKV